MKDGAHARSLYDGDALVAEYDGSGTLTNRFVHGSKAAADDPLLCYVGTGTGTKRYLHADHLGSVVAVTNSSGGALLGTVATTVAIIAVASAGFLLLTGRINVRRAARS